MEARIEEDEYTVPVDTLYLIRLFQHICAKIVGGNLYLNISMDRACRVAFPYELDRGYDYHGGTIVLSNYLEQWLESNKASLRLKTVYQYSQIIGKYIVPHLGGVKLNELRIVNIEQFYSTLTQNNSGIRTVCITHAILHRALEKAARYGLINRNPAHGAALPKYNQAEMRILDEGQVGRFLMATQGSPYQALYHLAVTTGMRQGELFGLKWADLQWGSGTLHIQRQVQKVPGVGWSFVEPKTRSGRRTIKLGEGTLQVLREHKERQALMITLARDRWKENDLIFPTSVGTPGDRSNLRADFRKILNSAGLPQIRFHDLRHTAASLLLNHGVPVIVVSKMLGHSKPSITLDVYGHLLYEQQNEAAKIMDELVTPIRVDIPANAVRDHS